MNDHDPLGNDFVTIEVVVDLAANVIRLRVPEFPGAPDSNIDATLDVGANGRLIGLQIEDRYVSVMNLPGADEPYVRSADVIVALSAGSPQWISIPRRGAGYEITYPSGNECWQMKNVDGELIQVCSVRATTDAAPEALNDAPAPGTTPDLPPGIDPGSRGPR